MELDILAFGAHPDDVELSAGATLAKHVDLGFTVGIVDLTLSQLSTRGTVENRRIEAENAAKVLGVHVRENLEMEDGWFTIDQHHIIKVIEIIRKYRPKIILANATHDRHPDHGRAAELIKQAHFLSGLRKIETTYNGIEQEAWRADQLFHYIQFQSIEPDFVVDIRSYSQRKMDALLAYKSQFYDPKSSEPATLISSKAFWDFLTARDTYTGAMAEIFEAEGFESAKKIAVNNFFDIVNS